MSSIWLHEFYYLFGFLSLVLLIVLITCAEISIALTYFQLTSEDYRWWWTSFSASGCSGIYVFLYSIMCAGAGAGSAELRKVLQKLGQVPRISGG
ncbi:Transmembrane 9 superfamily member 9 (Endomembrane protein 2) (Transmembrane nine protein 9) (AtTMN9) [Durusdinium trenchii]|uniref:Transmembrane 9 superfamily member n=1 Tax=Durusdinium trenchii TaxID=1381693 RepID=A0ABP0HAJ9_9DINO